MTVTRVPASNPEPEVPITDPRWLVSTQPDPTPEIDGGLDGRGTTHAADLPASAHVWGQTLAPVDLEIDTEGEAPVKRTLCLALSDDRNMPLQCRFKVDHATRHEWEIDNSPLTQGRAERLREEQDTPSGRLPRRVPGEALEEEREVIETWPA